MLKMCHVIEACILQGENMEKMTVIGKELPDDSCNLRLNVNGKSAPVSLAQFYQVFVDRPLLLLELQLLCVSLNSRFDSIGL